MGLNIKYDADINDKIQFHVTNHLPQLVTGHYEYTRLNTNNFNACISPTDCLTLNSFSDTDYSISVDGKTLFEDMSGTSKVRFGYSSDGTMAPNTCDDYIICNREIPAKTPQRRLVNLITRVSGLNLFGAGSSTNQYDSLCWWINDLD